MNTSPNPSRRPAPARPHQRIDYPTESHQDRQQRKLRGLSREVGQACNAWLASRGIFYRQWERASQLGGENKPVVVEFHFSNEL